MTGRALWRIRVADGIRWASGDPSQGPTHLLDPGVDLDDVLAGRGPSLQQLVASQDTQQRLEEACTVLAPVQGQDVWAAGVTYERSRQARNEESGSPDFYDKAYLAERPELFFKSAARAVRGPDALIGVRADSAWNLPEPELGLVIDSHGVIAGCVIGNDVSSRSIEGQNPLYLPQAKVYRGSCAVGPCIVPLSECPPLATMSIEMTIMRAGVSVYDETVHVADMRRDPEELAGWLFRAQDFPQGVVLLTGTSMVPPSEFTLTPGDTVTIAIDGLGRLGNVVEEVAA